MAKNTTCTNGPIGFGFAVRSLLYLLLLDGALTASIVEDLSTIDLLNLIRYAVSPPASGMHFMIWSLEFEAEAEKLAMKCELAVPKPGVIYFNMSSGEAYNEGLRNIVMLGRQAIRDGRCESDESRYLPCRFYRDLMDAGADRIGCSYARCPEFQILFYCVTNARSSNESFTDLGYKRGTPCQTCPASSGYCYRNLCVSHATKTAIQAKAPSAVITCDAPCLNCGKRMEANNSCFCQCPKGCASEVDCSEGSGSLTCSACQRAVTPCRNGGREVGGPSGQFRCLCNGDYGGQFCEVPMAQIVGGMVVRLKYQYPIGYFPFRHVEKVDEELKQLVADGVNSFCRANQTNYIKCCGSGDLPISDPIDFVDNSSVHVTSLFLNSNKSLTEATCTIYATAKGDNGLCRKRTSFPVPILAVPPSVIKTVLEHQVVRKHLYHSVFVKKVIKSYAEYYNVSMPKMNYISVKVG